MTRRPGQTHERVAREEIINPPSDRSFGFTMAAVCGLVAVFYGVSGRWWYGWAGGAAMLAAVALLAAPWLHGLNRVWLRLGLLLHRVTNPIVLAMLFGIVTLYGLVLRAAGWRPLPRSFDQGIETYWIERTGAPTSLDRLRRQF